MAGVNGFGLIGGDVEKRRVERCDAFLKEVCSLDVELGCIWVSLPGIWDRRNQSHRATSLRIRMVEGRGAHSILGNLRP